MAMPALQSSGLSSAEQAEVSRMVSGVTDHYYRMMYLSSSASAQADGSSQAGGGTAAGGDGGSESIQEDLMDLRALFERVTKRSGAGARAGGAGASSEGEKKSVEEDQLEDPTVQRSAGEPRQRGRMSIASIQASQMGDIDDTSSLAARMLEAFEAIDIDGSGHLDDEELLLALKKMGMDVPVDKAAASAFLAQFPKNEEGTVDFKSFSEGYMKQQAIKSDAAKSALVQHLTGRQEKITSFSGNRGKGGLDYTVKGKDFDKLFNPLDLFSSMWDFVVTMVLISTLITMPLSLGFKPIENSLFYWNFIVDMTFLIDWVKNFFTGYINSDQVLVMDHKTVVKYYISGWCFPDLVSSIPISAILKWSGAESGAESAAAKDAGKVKTFKMLRLMRLAKIFRLLRVSRVFKYFKIGLVWAEEKLKFKLTDSTLKLYKLLFTVLLIALWVGCIIFMVEEDAEFPEGSWTHYFGLQDAPVGVQFSWCYWKALVMLIMLEPDGRTWCEDFDSDGHMKSWCVTEHWITLICYYIGAIMYSVLISNFSSILMSMNMAGQAYEEKMQTVNEYMKTHRLPTELRDNVRELYRLRFSDGKLLPPADVVLKELTPQLRSEINHYINTEMLCKVPVLTAGLVELNIDRPKRLLASLSVGLQPRIYFEGETMIEEGTTATEMFFVFSGVLEILTKHHPDGPVNLVGDGCYVGDVGCLLDDADGSVKRTASVRAQQTCVLYGLGKDFLLRILDDYPDLHEYMLIVAISRQERMKNFDPMNPNPNFDDYEDAEDAKTALFSGYREPSSPKSKTVQVAPAPTGGVLAPLPKFGDEVKLGAMKKRAAMQRQATHKALMLRRGSAVTSTTAKAAPL
mmetsp:Transcript_20395/g.47391  ORF Transcript_20395/g.47391 Transcript_20395/m.47391 type:complete len:855 (-) Transcript_20395:14-2578(-)